MPFYYSYSSTLISWGDSKEAAWNLSSERQALRFYETQGRVGHRCLPTSHRSPDEIDKEREGI